VTPCILIEAVEIHLQEPIEIERTLREVRPIALLTALMGPYLIRLQLI
jgi:hypothetical protein